MLIAACSVVEVVRCVGANHCMQGAIRSRPLLWAVRPLGERVNCGDIRSVFSGWNLENFYLMGTMRTRCFAGSVGMDCLCFLGGGMAGLTVLLGKNADFFLEARIEMQIW